MGEGVIIPSGGWLGMLGYRYPKGGWESQRVGVGIPGPMSVSRHTPVKTLTPAGGK